MNKIIKMLLIVGVVFTPFIIGSLVTIISMVRSFHELGDNGINDPKQLAAQIGTAMVATWLGIVISMVLFVALSVYLLITGLKKPKGTTT